MSATVSPRGQKRRGETLQSERVCPAPVERAAKIVSNNSNTTFNLGRDVVNNNWVNNHFYQEPIASDFAKKQEEARKAIKATLGEQIVPDAWHDTQPTDSGCMPGTRKSVLLKFMEWVKHDPMAIFWLAGMAGTGKTSIALTLCRMLSSDTEVLFGGGYFCSRSAGSIARTDVRRIVPTLAALLADSSPEFMLALAAELTADPRVAHKPVSDQITSLLDRPLAALASSTRQIVFVIDALDECSDVREVSELLGAIANFRSDARVKFILTSRPEMHIRGTPISNPEHHSILHLHTISDEEVEADIRCYVSGTLRDATADATWYTNDDVEALVRLSRGLFIFASTVLLYVRARENVKGRKERLRKVVSTAGLGSAATVNLDKVYEMIVLEASRADLVDADELEATKRVLACILAARVLLSVQALADILGLDVDDLRGSLERLHSVIYLPPNDLVPGLRALHASFGDYVLSRAAPGVRITISLGDLVLARGCLDVMARRLHFNLARVQSSYKPNPSTPSDCIRLSLEYACLQWIYHVSAVSDPSTFDQEISVTFLPRFLFWLEAISILGRVSRAAAMLLFAVSTFRSADIARLLRDAHAFVASSWEAIEKSAPHIYLSALPFARKGSLIYQTFAPLCTGLITVDTFGIDRHGGRLVMSLPGRQEYVISYSPDGRLLSSGSENGVIRIWDTRTGEETMSLQLRDESPIQSLAFSRNGKNLLLCSKGGVFIWSFSHGYAAPQLLYDHSQIDRPVSFSPDGSLIAYGQKDFTIHLRKTTTHVQPAVLSGHTAAICAISFSQSGEVLASGADDGAILLWNSSTGERVVQLTDRGVCKAISSLSFSHDGARLVSTSGIDIQIWRLQTRAIIAKLRGSKRRFHSVQFSPDGKSLLAISNDRSIRLWALKDNSTAAFVIVLATSQSSAVFSPDGLYIASTSEDTIRIWDAGSNNQATKPLLAHDRGISSLAVSIDGNFIVSGCVDQIVRVWDARTGKLKLPPLIGHTKTVSSVAVSSHGRLIATGSCDETLRFWKAQTGEAVGEPLRGHQKRITAVAFSPDSRCIASASHDKSVRVWDCETRQALHIGPLMSSDPVRSVAFSPDGRLLAAGDHSGRINIWELGSGLGKLHREPFHAGIQRVDSIAFSPTGAHIVSSGDNKICRVWNVKSGRQVLSLRGHELSVLSVTTSSDGRFICTSGLDNTVRLWNAVKGTLLATLHGHRSTVTSVTFASHGRSIVSCSEKMIRVWNVEAARTSSSANACDLVAALASTNFDDRGWLLGPKGELLLWVPAEYQEYVQTRPCTTLIGRHRVLITANGSGLCTGETWTACWRGKAM